MLPAVGRPPTRPGNYGLMHPLGNRSSLFPSKIRLFRADHTSHYQRAARRNVVTAYLGDPWKILGLSQTADEKEIKRAHRKLVLQHHPDISKDDPAAESLFLAIQEAYEIIMGRKRGKELDASPQGNGWDFHDWYWHFSMSKRWGRSKKNRREGPANPFASSTEPPRAQWKAQLDGLRRKAAAKRAQQRHSSRGSSWSSSGGPAAGQAWGGARGCATATRRQQNQDGYQGQQKGTQQQRPERPDARKDGAAAAAWQTAQSMQPSEVDQRSDAPQESIHATREVKGEAAPDSGGLHVKSKPDAHKASEGPGPFRAGSMFRHGTTVAAEHTTAEGQLAGFGQGGEMRHRLAEGFQQQGNGAHYQMPQQQQQAGSAQQELGGGLDVAAQHEKHDQVLGFVSMVLGQLQVLSWHSESTLQSHVAELVRHVFQLGQNLQVHLMRLCTPSMFGHAGTAPAHHVQQAQQSELHLEFQQTIRLRQQAGCQGPFRPIEVWDCAANVQHYDILADGACATAGAGALGSSGSFESATAANSSDEGDQFWQREQPQQHQSRSKFVNDGQVRDRVSSQLAGLKRRAAIRLELGE